MRGFKVSNTCTPPCVALSELVHVLMVDCVGGEIFVEKVRQVGLVQIMTKVCAQQEMMGAADCSGMTMDDFVGCIVSSMPKPNDIDSRKIKREEILVTNFRL